MTAEQILTIAKEKGVMLEVRSGKIRCKAPKGILTKELIDSLRVNKPVLLKLLSDGEHVEGSTSEKPPKCLGVLCCAVRYQDIEGHLCLWCGHLNRAVINLMACPFEAWGKDEKGFPRDN